VDPAEPTIEALSAVTLVTTDMVRAVAFYEAMGFERLYGGPDTGFTSFRVGAGFVSLQLGSRTQRQVWGRVIFSVSDVDAFHDRAVAAGYRPEAEPRDAEWGERYFHIRDPDGHELSFARPLAH
jgi:catechol 2,3-dioxygenase-like lactoylglutathione lyase family enzyme